MYFLLHLLTNTSFAMLENFNKTETKLTNLSLIQSLLWVLGLPAGGASGKEPACRARRRKRHPGGLIPGSGRSPGGGHGNPLHNSCLENPMDTEAWQATVQGHKEPDTTEVTKHARMFMRLK